MASKLLKQCLWLMVATSPLCASSPCDGVDRSLTDQRKATWAAVIAKQLRVQRVDVQQSFRHGGWSIIYVHTPDSDPPFLFYSGDPQRPHYVTLWSGVALRNEQEDIRRWTLK